MLRRACTSRAVVQYALPLLIVTGFLTTRELSASKLVSVSGTLLCNETWQTPPNSVGVFYDPHAGHLRVDVDGGQLTTIEIKSKGQLFNPAGVPAGTISPPFDVATKAKLFVLRTGGIPNIDFGSALPGGLLDSQMIADLEFAGSFLGGGNLLSRGGGGPYSLHHHGCHLGDFNNSRSLDAADVDAMVVGMAENNLAFDLDGDGDADISDRTYWVHELTRTWYGDANLDQVFNTTDLVAVFQSGHYEDTRSKNSDWSTGDWNGDGEFTSSDLMVAFDDGGYEAGPRAAVAAVPEPTGLLLLGIGLFVCWVRRWDRHAA